jgi:hypothetical protein
MQHLLARARWDAGGVRDDLRGYVIEHLGKHDARHRLRWSRWRRRHQHQSRTYHHQRQTALDQGT